MKEGTRLLLIFEGLTMSNGSITARPNTTITATSREEPISSSVANEAANMSRADAHSGSSSPLSEVPSDTVADAFAEPSQPARMPADSAITSRPMRSVRRARPTYVDVMDVDDDEPQAHNDDSGSDFDKKMAVEDLSDDAFEFDASDASAYEDEPKSKGNKRDRAVLKPTKGQAKVLPPSLGSRKCKRVKVKQDNRDNDANNGSAGVRADTELENGPNDADLGSRDGNEAAGGDDSVEFDLQPAFRKNHFDIVLDPIQHKKAFDLYQLALQKQRTIHPHNVGLMKLFCLLEASGVSGIGEILGAEKILEDAKDGHINYKNDGCYNGVLPPTYQPIDTRRAQLCSYQCPVRGCLFSAENPNPKPGKPGFIYRKEKVFSHLRTVHFAKHAVSYNPDGSLSKWDELNDPVHPHLIAKGLTAPAVPAGLVFGPNSTTAKSNVLAATRILQGDKSLALGYMNILLAILEVADVMITFGDEQGQGVAKVLVYIPSMHKNMSIDVAGFVYYYVRLKTYIQTQRPQWLAGTNFTLPAYVGPKITAQGNDANGVAFSMPAKYAQGQTLFPPAQHFTMCNDEPSRYLSHHAEMSIYKGLCRIFNLDMAGFFNNNDVAERDRVEIGQLMLTCRDGDLSIVRMAIAQHFQQQQNAYVANDDIPAEDRAEIDELLQPERDMVEAGGDEAEQS